MELLNHCILSLTKDHEFGTIEHYGLEILKDSAIKKDSEFHNSVQKSLVGFLLTILDHAQTLVNSKNFDDVVEILHLIREWTEELTVSFLEDLARANFFRQYSIIISLYCRRPNSQEGYIHDTYDKIEDLRMYSGVFLLVKQSLDTKNDDKLSSMIILAMRPLVAITCELFQLIEPEFTDGARVFIFGLDTENDKLSFDEGYNEGYISCFEDIINVINMVLDQKTPDTRAFYQIVTSGSLNTFVKLNDYIRDVLNKTTDIMAHLLGSLHRYLHKFGHMFSSNDIIKMAPWIISFISDKSIQHHKTKFFWQAGNGMDVVYSSLWFEASLYSECHTSVVSYSNQVGQVQSNAGSQPYLRVQPTMAASAIKFLSSVSESKYFNEEKRIMYFKKLEENDGFRIIAEFIKKNYTDSDTTQVVLRELTFGMFAPKKGTLFPLEDFSELLPLMLNFMKRTKSIKKSAHSCSYNLKRSVMCFLPLFVRDTTIEKLRELEDTHNLTDVLLECFYQSDKKGAVRIWGCCSVLLSHLFVLLRLNKGDDFARRIMSKLPAVWHLIQKYKTEDDLGNGRLTYLGCSSMFLRALSKLPCQSDQLICSLSEEMVTDCIQLFKFDYSGPGASVHSEIFKIAWFWIRTDKSKSFIEYLNQISSSGDYSIPTQKSSESPDINKESVYLFLCKTMTTYLDFLRGKLLSNKGESEEKEENTPELLFSRYNELDDMLLFTEKVLDIVKSSASDKELYALEDLVSPLIWAIEGVEHEKIIRNVKDFVGILR